MSTIAILDLGTNTFHILIADRDLHSPVIIFQETIAVKLGEGGISKKIISGDAFERGLNAIKKFKAYIDQFEVDEIKAVATSALRTATNGKDFLNRVEAETGVQVIFIEGDREAELIYHGVRRAVDLSKSKALIIDIGGGSTEFILCNEKQIFWKKSFEIGAARLKDQFHHTDPISEFEIGELTKHLNTILPELKAELITHQPDLLVGSAGAFETFAALCDQEYTDTTETAFTFDLNKIREIFEWIIKSNHEEREQSQLIIPVRVDMIVTATLLTRYVLSLHPFKAMQLSRYSLKEGLLFENY